MTPSHSLRWVACLIVPVLVMPSAGEDVFREAFEVEGDRPPLEHAWGEGAKGFAALDFQVEDVLHVRPARVAEDRTVAQRTRAPLQAALKPADHLAVGNRCGRAPAEFTFIGNLLDRATLPGQVRLPCGQQFTDRRIAESPFHPGQGGS